MAGPENVKSQPNITENTETEQGITKDDGQIPSKETEKTDAVEPRKSKPKPYDTTLPLAAMQQRMFNNYMNPMLSDLEKTIAKNTEKLDEMNKKFAEEREERRKERLSQHIPEILRGSGQELDSVIEHLHNLMVYEYYNKEEGQDTSQLVPAKLKELDELSEVTVVSHSLAAYISTFEPAHLKHLCNRILSDLTVWISKLFRFADANAYFHEEDREGFIRVCRLVLQLKYPKLAVEGYEALYSRPPMIYLSSTAANGWGHQICCQLNLPESCLRIVPFSKNVGSATKLDTEELSKMVEDDKAAGKTPFLLLSFAGTPVVGQNDNLDKIQEICKKDGIWLHVEGNNLATLMLYSVQSSVSSAKAGDSITVNLGAWLGLPAVPYTTLYKAGDLETASKVGLTAFNTRFKLSCLPLWICLQAMGMDGITARVKMACDLGKRLSENVDKISNVKNLSKKIKPPEPEGGTGLKSLINKAIDALVIFEMENPTVVFRYNGPTLTEDAKEVKETTDIENDESDNSVEMDKYLDSLNIWLAETLRKINPSVHVTAVEVPSVGIACRFAALESAHKFGTKAEDIDKFVSTLKEHVSILDATVRQRPVFKDIVEAQGNLILVEVANWAGLGCVQYIPETMIDRKHNLGEADKAEVNELNKCILHQLRSSDTAFSLGTSVDGYNCVRFGLIMDNADLEELVTLVFTTGKEVEDSSKFLETMAEKIRQGIEAANTDLQKENENKLIQEGVLRQVPLIGSMINWWSPPGKEADVKGRTFNLQTGNIQSTESTYKYHMQVQESTPEPSPVKKDGKFTEQKVKQIGSPLSNETSQQNASLEDVTEEKTSLDATQQGNVQSSTQKENDSTLDLK